MRSRSASRSAPPNLESSSLERKRVSFLLAIFFYASRWVVGSQALLDGKLKNSAEHAKRSVCCTFTASHAGPAPGSRLYILRRFARSYITHHALNVRPRDLRRAFIAKQGQHMRIHSRAIHLKSCGFFWCARPPQGIFRTEPRPLYRIGLCA